MPGSRDRTDSAKRDEAPTLGFSDAKKFSEWLRVNHASSTGLWLKLAKGGSEAAPLTYAQAVEVGLRWGWIDGQKKAFDAQAWLQKFTPRGSRSVWSRINRDKALALIAAGKMEPAGLAAVKQAKENGRWDAAYEPPSTSKLPEDFMAALAANPKASAFFVTINASNRYAMFWRIHTVKKAETRARHIARFVEMLARHETLHP